MALNIKPRLLHCPSCKKDFTNDDIFPHCPDCKTPLIKVMFSLMTGERLDSTKFETLKGDKS